MNTGVILYISFWFIVALTWFIGHLFGGGVKSITKEYLP